MKQIPLTQGLFSIVDDEDFDELNKFKWYAHRYNKIYYACRTAKDGGKQFTVLMHRFINKTCDNFITDHINGDGLDNRKENLRAVTSLQNNINRKMRHDNKSGHRGVTWQTSAKKWKVDIRINNKTHYVGLFFCIKKAIDARVTIEKELRGNEFRRCP